MAFNSQGHWKQAEWDAFKTWATDRINTKDKRLHRLRFQSAIVRRRLASLLRSTPPTFDSNVKKASVLFDENGASTFKPEWIPPQTALGPVVVPASVKPDESVGSKTNPMKDILYRELRLVEYFEHLIQKTRFELEQIEDEIFRLETADIKLTQNMKDIDAKFESPEYTQSLLKKDTLVTDNIFSDVPQRLADYQREAFIEPETRLGQPQGES